ncbi:phage tail tape measure protein [Glycomyces artemisiae]|uniref:TP901 family phage tail tape measure protein n=1 Tax=Glycomyces artemisiae TaxID=1076443 RepID=A0A2T0UEY2_9ACTN|nr:phage tail tape measure protein [Glycomyces artemisiae]PRY56434.1 TP901 family phage tail tape measure protein [Glycomyces artemisiae]
MANRTVTVGLRMQMASAIGAVRGYRQEWIKARDELHKNMLDHRQATRDLADTAQKTGAVMVGAVALAVVKSAEFEAQMSAVNAALRESDENMQRLREAALAAGKDTKYSAVEAAQAIEELGKAGVGTEDILSGGLNGALALAASGNLEVAKAAEIAAIAMQQFGLSGSQIPHVADLLSAGAGKSLGSVEDLGAALQQSGLVANQFGISIEDTTGALAAFAAAGLIGSDSGTSLKTMLTMLANPSKESAELMEQLGINAYDAAGQFVGLTDLAGQLQTKMGGLTQAQRDQALAQIFGTDALRAANVLYEEGAAGIRDWTLAVSDSGYASEVAAARMDNLKGDAERLASTVESTLVGAGSGANDVLRTLTQTTTGLVEQFSTLPGPVQTSLLTITGLGGAGLIAAGGLAKLVVSAAETREAIAELQRNGSKADRTMMRVAKGAGIASAAIATIGVGNTALARDVTYDLENLTKALEKYGKTGEATGEASKLWGDDLGLLSNDLNVLEKSWYDVTGTAIAAGVEWATFANAWSDDTVSQAKDRIDGLDQALADMVASGNGDQAAAAFSRIAQMAEAEGVSIDEVKQGLPLYQAAMENAIQPTEDVSAATRIYADSLGVVPELAEEAQAGITQFEEALKTLTDTLFGVEEAEDRVATLVNQAKEAFAENGGAVTGNTEAALANRETLRSLITAYMDQILAVAEATGSQEEAMGVAEDLEGQFRSLAGQLGLSEEQVDDYAAAFDDIPSLVQTTVRTTYEYRYVTVKPSGPSGLAVPGLADGGYFGYADGGAVQRYPKGGAVYGAGGPRTDSINAKLSTGEFVVNAFATRRNRMLLEAINANQFNWSDLAAGGSMRQAAYGAPMGAMSFSDGRVIVEFRFQGAADSFTRAIRDAAYLHGQGNVQYAFGTS